MVLTDKATRQPQTVWQPKPDHHNNHFLDAAKLAAMGSLDLGCRPTYIAAPTKAGATRKAPKWAEI